VIPLRDANPSRTVPFVTYTLIGINVLVFLFEASLGRNLGEFIFTFGVVPARWTEAVSAMRFDAGAVVPFLTSMFLHGGWLHLIGNMWFLHIFGDNVEDLFGHLKYLFFYLFAGTAAAAAQILVNPASEAPMVGASGAIAGVLGAYVFLFPSARVATMIPLFVVFPIVELPAFVFLGLWFLLQAASGLMSLGIGGDAGGVAWWAHIGGFAAGAVLFPFLRKPQLQ